MTIVLLDFNRLDCLHGLRNARRFSLVFPLFSFSSRVRMTKLAFSQFLITQKQKLLFIVFLTCVKTDARSVGDSHPSC